MAKAKQRSFIRNYLEYIALRLVVAVLQALSLRAAYRLAHGLAWLVYHVDRRHRLVALKNLQIAYPEWSAAQRDKVVRQVYQHFCKMGMEMTHLPRLLQMYNWKPYMELRGSKGLFSAMLSGRPVLIITGHLGNWELAGYALAMFGFKSYGVARTLDNPYLDKFVNAFRRKTGQVLLSKNGDARRMAELLKSGGILSTLPDQDAGPRGLFVPFFGKPASTHKAVAQMALNHDAVIAVVGAWRISQGLKYAIDVEEVIDASDFADKPEPILRLTEAYTAAWERLVRKAPEQYLWLHRRWKHEPRAAA